MEERLIDNERGIKIKRKREGLDAVDALADDGAEEEIPEEELVLELPDGEEYDEDLVGLTPSQLKEELARREKAAREARAESEKLALAGAEKLGEENFEEAESLFAQAVTYDPENAEAGKGLWQARTKNFTDGEAFYAGDNAEELAASIEAVRAYVLDRAGERLREERETYRQEEEPLKEKVEESMEFRRGYFRDNRRYYLVRFGIFVGIMLLCLIGAAVSASFLYSTQSITPIVLIGCFGGVAAVMLAVAIVFSRKLLVAHRLCRANENLSSTEDGARLAYLQERLRCLQLVLDGRTNEEE
ncbi:MAG: hypothetical protein K2H43_01525 [Clostridia bacterium]|nr:hypothetical protein [Clostridia bacterium]